MALLISSTIAGIVFSLSACIIENFFENKKSYDIPVICGKSKTGRHRH